MGLWDAVKTVGQAVADKAEHDREIREELESYDDDELKQKLNSSWSSAKEKMIIRRILRDRR